MSGRYRRGATNVYLVLRAGMAFLYALSFTVNLVYHVESVGLNPLQLVLVGTVLELTCFLGEVPTGVVADVYSRRLSIVIGVGLIGLGFLIEGSFAAFETVLLAQVVWGLGYTFTSGAEQAWVADEVGAENAGRVYIRGTQIGSIGGLLAAPVSVALAGIALWLPIVAAGVGFLLLGAFLALAMPERGFRPAPREERETFRAMSATFIAGTRAVRRRPILLTILAISLFYGLYSEGFDRLWTAHLLENFSLPGLGPFEPVVWFGVIAVATSLLSIAANEVISRRVDLAAHHAVTRTLFLADGLLIAGLLVFAFAGTFAVALAALLLAAVCRELHDPLATAWANQSIDARVRATVLSMNGQVNAFGQVAGGPAVGVIGRTVSIRAALAASAAILVPVLGLYARALGHRRRAWTEEEPGTSQPTVE